MSPGPDAVLALLRERVSPWQIAERLPGVDPADVAVAMEARRLNLGEEEIIQLAEARIGIFHASIQAGFTNERPLTDAPGDWSRRMLAHEGDVGWRAGAAALAVQEANAAAGVVAAAPTCGAAGTVPGTLWALARSLGTDRRTEARAALVAAVVGRAGMQNGRVAGAFAGCWAETGVAAAMAAGGAAWLLGGGWRQIDAAACLATVNFMGNECAPSGGRVEYPCIPRNSFAAVAAIHAARQAVWCGMQPQHDLVRHLKVGFAVGRALPRKGKETEEGEWGSGLINDLLSGPCPTCGRGV